MRHDKNGTVNVLAGSHTPCFKRAVNCYYAAKRDFLWGVDRKVVIVRRLSLPTANQREIDKVRIQQHLGHVEKRHYLLLTT
ncbi:hypothetical protein D3C80_1780030 [compost metagenome]